MYVVCLVHPANMNTLKSIQSKANSSEQHTIYVIAFDNIFYRQITVATFALKNIY